MAGFSDPAIRAKAKATQEANRRELEEFRAWKASRETQAAPVGVPRTAAADNGKLSRRERFLAEDGEDVTTVQDARELGSGEIADLAQKNYDLAQQRTTVTHTTTREAVAYDRRGIAKRVLRSAWLTQLQEPGPDGKPLWFEDCPLCGGLHPETEYDPNTCPARAQAPVMVVACPARTDCAWEGRVFPEDEARQGGKQLSKGEQLFPMTEDTRKAIGRSLALAHAWAKHPTESMGRGLPNPNAGQPQAAVA